jgi:hypothetical protein
MSCFRDSSSQFSPHIALGDVHAGLLTLGFSYEQLLSKRAIMNWLVFLSNYYEHLWSDTLSLEDVRSLQICNMDACTTRLSNLDTTIIVSFI